MTTAGAKVAFVIPYLGEWPVWMPLFLRSCATNPAAHFHLFGSRPLQEPLPSNVRCHAISAPEIEGRARSKLGIDLRLRDAHKLCDLKPFYGILFGDVVAPYDFWGYCDLDLVFGDLSRVLDDAFLSEVDVFSAWDSRQIVGHFTLIRNSTGLASLSFEIENWQEQLIGFPGNTFMDEGGLSLALAAHPEVRWKHAHAVDQEFASGRASVGATILYDGRVFDYVVTGPVACIWDGRRTYVRNPGRPDVEVLYIHFMGTESGHTTGFISSVAASTHLVPSLPEDSTTTLCRLQSSYRSGIDLACSLCGALSPSSPSPVLRFLGGSERPSFAR